MTQSEDPTKSVDRRSIVATCGTRRGIHSLLEQTEKWSFNTVLDIGTGSGFATRYFATRGKQVTSTGFHIDRYLGEPLPQQVTILPDVDVCDMAALCDESFDAVWCSHVIEHVPNVGSALAEIRRVLRPGGRLFLIVPEYAPVLVGGHISTGWTIGTLMYNLVLAGFDVRDGEFINHCWNVSGFVRKGAAPTVDLVYDKGDLEVLSEHFPPEMRIRQGMNADLQRLNWIWREPIKKKAEREFAIVAWHKRLVDCVPPALMRQWRKLRHCE